MDSVGTRRRSAARRTRMIALDRWIGGRISALLIAWLLGLAAVALAYQAPAQGWVAVGWLGDRLFVRAAPNVQVADADTSALYRDDLTPDSPTGRSRWTRDQARITLPNLGRGSDLQLRLIAQGWPTDVLGQRVSQPVITVFADGSQVGQFTPTSAWRDERFTIPSQLRQQGDLVIDLVASATFTGTAGFGPDPRPKGIRLAAVEVLAADEGGNVLLPPAAGALALMMLCVGLTFVIIDRLSRSNPVPTFFAVTIAAALSAAGLAFARIWMGAILTVAGSLLVVGVIAVYLPEILRLMRALGRRYSRGAGLGFGLIAAAAFLLVYLLGRWLSTSPAMPELRLTPERLFDTILLGVLGAGFVGLAITLGRDGLPRLADAAVNLLRSRAGALVILSLFLLVWLGYETSLLLRLPYVGHADYSDNAIVARNLANGRGWVVDYVSQFYYAYPSLTRPQETWPLLQPVWIVPFFWLFGATELAARLPNLLFNLLLALLIYKIGARIWDRRVALLAVAFTLTSYLFVRLTIYVTNDLGFTLFSMAALYGLYCWDEATRQQRRAWPFALGAGLMTGLMMLQKPSGAMIAVGMGLWMLWRLQPQQLLLRAHATPWRQRFAQIAGPALAWGLTALLVLSPYFARNLILFERPVYSTESYDAWILGYPGGRGDPWEEIYRVYTPEFGGSGTPDRSWILRWGFDATYAKFEDQVRALRDYLVPVWQGAPPASAEWFGQNESRNILSATGAWLALLGALARRRERRRLVGLLLAAFTPYVIFMLTYWRTDEERYWVMLLPWLALLAAGALWSGYDQLARRGGRRWSPVALLLVVAAAGSIFAHSGPKISANVNRDPYAWSIDLATYAWLDANLPPGAPVMTRIPWQLNWHTGRPALMIPNTSDRETLLAIARHYGVEYIALESQLRVKGDGGDLLAPLLQSGAVAVGEDLDGFELLYASPTDDFHTFIYRLPRDDAQAQP